MLLITAAGATVGALVFIGAFGLTVWFTILAIMMCIGSPDVKDKEHFDD